MEELRGIDVSHWQTENTVLAEIDNCDFVIIKATEGKTYTDNMFTTHLKNAMQKGKLIGVYHYARPENNNYKDEVENFLKSFSNVSGKALPILDWEGNSWNFSIDWCINWLDYFYEKTGIKPFLYISASRYKNLPKYIKDNYPLWIASYGTNDGMRQDKALSKYVPSEFVTMWQYTSKPLDRDIFFGNVEKWKSMCRNNKVEMKANRETILEKINNILFNIEEIERLL